ncbi:toxin [Flavipsychrobacter stenotrophus]|uniref:Toxin n=1 Tax=Flavipsychrobacter stenotrophus TaxID=2077091 RepID=A0A2S7T0J2_9BACT|nr:toxin [Flavipsychrobacter stenotrophus]PQJ12448.1 toxin [Flavipsychrobacter stenotrophus]
MISPSTNIGHPPNLRLRVFAGPNGSGKSTVIQFVRNSKVNGKPIDFGIYINADDIARQLRNNTFTFSDYEITTDKKEFTETARSSGLIGKPFNEQMFAQAFYIRNNELKLKNFKTDERLAQIIADFLRKKLLKEQRKFSFETVFSHPSKLDIMRQAVEAGYKVYLYFVSTRSPKINKFRVLARKAKGGHDVPPDKIESRYYRSLDLLFDASQIAYQAFFWDNSINGSEAKLFAHFKKNGNKKAWDTINKNDVPNWFREYYSKKVGGVK